ncbi:MAG: rane protein of unknown function [Candidatus Saccharibacteria bacterium]|nr:rane protein of unknown function [Candidatus Saccharibacteria bacterium]
MERVWSTSRRGFSVRSILTFVLTVFIAALLWATFGSHTATHAAASPATWKGASILYDGHQYFAQTAAKAGDSINLPVGTNYYLYTPDNSGGNPPATVKAFVIYFTPGVDPPTAQTATFATYDYSSQKVFSNPSSKQAITITPQGSQSSYSSCTIQGVGWIICPITTFLADGMDNIFNIVKGFLVVQPANTTNTNNDLYIAWNVMRGIANVAFIIVFLIIIYSQLTNMGISNYGLKKLLPRLIIAAVLVNVSYIICALALDISNILGYSLQDVFNTIRQNTFNISNDTWTNSNDMGWSAITAFVLSGGAATIGVIIATGGTIASAVYLLVPVLIGLLGTILVVLLILAARQAIIIILIVIAPLAFVAYLLPNTEQWFKKWRELFMTMLIFFPAFSLVFGGSQLAGGIIIQNATSITVVIFGLAVQVAPLVITPLLLKLSGGLLGKIAGIVNDPKKGLLDRTKAWSGDRAAMHRQRGLRDNNLKWYNGARRIARALDNNNRRVKDRTGLYTTEGENRYHKMPGYRNLHTDMHQADLAKERIENQNKAHAQHVLNSTGSALHLENLRLEASKVALTRATEVTNADIKEYGSGRRVATGELNTLMTDMKADITATAAETQRAQSASYMQQKNISSAFTANTVASRALLNVAAGVDPNGLIRAEASARGALIKLEKEALDSSVQLLNARAIESGTTLKNYAINLASAASTGTSREPAALIEAAVEAAAQDGQVSLMRTLRMSRDIDQSMVTRVLARNAATMKEKGGFDLQANPSLAGATQAQMNASVAETLGEISASNLSSVKAGFWGDIANLKGTNPQSSMQRVIADAKASGSPDSVNGLRKTYLTLTEALTNPDIRASLGDRLQETVAIHKALDAEYGDKPVDYSQFM